MTIKRKMSDNLHNIVKQ